MEYIWLVPLIAGGLRNLAGWLETSLKDGEIQSYEWGQLGKTLIEVVVLAIAAYYGLGTDIIQSSGLAVLGSYGISAIKKVGTD